MDKHSIDNSKRFISLRLKLVFAIIIVLLFSNGLNTTLNYLNFDKRLTQTSDSTFQVVVDETDKDIRQAMSLGLPLSSISNIQALIERRSKLVGGISSIQVVNNNGEIIFSTNGVPSNSDRLITSDIINTFSIKEGELKLFYSPFHLDKTKRVLLSTQIIYALFGVLITSVLGYWILNLLLDFLLSRVQLATDLSNTEDLPNNQILNSIKDLIILNKTRTGWERFRAKYFPLLVISLAIVLTIASNLGSSYQSLAMFSNVYQDQLQQKSNLIGDTLSNMISRLVEQGVPLNRLTGLEEEFAAYINHHPELLSIRLEESDETLYQYPTVFPDYADASLLSIPIDKTGFIQLQMMANTNIVPQLIKDSIMDMLTVLIASSLCVMEIILYVCNAMIIFPWRRIKQLIDIDENQQHHHIVRVQTNDELGILLRKLNQLVQKVFDNKTFSQTNIQDYRFVRLPLFILIFAETMSLAFFPNFVTSIPSSLNLIPQDLIIGVSISLFMLFWAISLPFAGYWSDKVGRRKSLIWGGGIISVGLFATAISPNLEVLLITRVITAIGFGIVFISAQGYITDTTTSQNRTKGMSSFSSAFFSGSLCGAAIGGVLADKLGYSITFVLASLLALLGSVLISASFDHSKSNVISNPVKLSDFKKLLSNRYFTLVALFSAIPAKIILTGFLYYICPVYLQSLGESSAVSGRVMMTYGLAIVFLAPLSAIVIDKWNNKMAFIFSGGVLCAVALINIVALPGTQGLLLIVILVGFAHGISVSPQVPLVIEHLGESHLDKGKTIGIFRLIERIGNISGPLVAGLCLSVLSFESTILLFGVMLLISSVILLSFYSAFVHRDKKQMEVVK